MDEDEGIAYLLVRGTIENFSLEVTQCESIDYPDILTNGKDTCWKAASFCILPKYGLADRKLCSIHPMVVRTKLLVEEHNI